MLSYSNNGIREMHLFYIFFSLFEAGKYIPALNDKK